MAERKVESLLNAIENFDEKLSPEKNTKETTVNKINALDLIGSSNTAIIAGSFIADSLARTLP